MGGSTIFSFDFYTGFTSVFEIEDFISFERGDLDLIVGEP